MIQSDAVPAHRVAHAGKEMTLVCNLTIRSAATAPVAKARLSLDDATANARGSTAIYVQVLNYRFGVAPGTGKA